MALSVRAGALAAAGLCLGCSFDSGGLGSAEGGDSSSSGGDTDSTTSAGSPTSADASDPSGPEDSGTETNGSEDTIGPVMGAAALNLSQGVDFGAVDILTTATHEFTVTNVGDETATRIAIGVSGADYTIVNNQCSDTLAGGDSCQFDVDFAPTALGRSRGTIDIDYHDSMVVQAIDRDIEGGGAGESENLLLNPGVETCSVGALPEAWIEVVGTDWHCVQQDGFGGGVHDGSFMIFAGDLPDGGATTQVELRQTIELPQEYVDLIEQGELGVSFRGYARSIQAGDDEFRIRLQFRRSDFSYLEEFFDPFADAATWQEIEHFILPDFETAVLSVRLDCSRLFGGQCDAYFDDLDLRVVYPPPA